MNLEIFKNSKFEIRGGLINGEPYFCLSDVCKILDLDNSRQAKTRLDQKGVISNDTLTNGGIQRMDFINEANLYRLIFQSRKPEAEAFQEWVFSDVLPAIRKHGGYLTPAKIEEVLSDPDTIIALAQNLKAERAKRERLEAEKAANAGYVSFAKSVEASVDSILIGNYAKLLSDSEGVSIGQNRLFDFLRASGYLISGGTRHNVPMQRYIDRGYFEVTTQTFAGSTGTHQKFTTKITGKGQIALAGKIVEYFKGERI